MDDAEENGQIVGEGKVAKYLEYWGLKEDPRNSRDFVDTKLVNIILEDILAGNNISLVGKAGTGKSALMREVMAKLPKDERYIITTVNMHTLVDPNAQYITKGGLIQIAKKILKSFESFFNTHENTGFPAGTSDAIQAIRQPKGDMDYAERFGFLEDFLEKVKEKEYRVVLIIDDTDDLQTFSDFNNLNLIMEEVYSTILAWKPAEKRSVMEGSVIRGENQTHTELAAEREQLEAFLRRITDVELLGQPATTMLQIVRGKLGKQDDIIADPELAYGFAAAYSVETKKDAKLEVFAGGYKPNQLLYNPGKMGIFLSRALKIGAMKNVKTITSEIAQYAYNKTVKGLRVYGELTVPNYDVHLNAIRTAREELARLKLK